MEWGLEERMRERVNENTKRLALTVVIFQFIVPRFVHLAKSVSLQSRGRYADSVLLMFGRVGVGGVVEGRA